jgi:branched-chain amino acid transport system permease protein
MLGAFMGLIGVNLQFGTAGTILFAMILTGVINAGINKAVLEPLRSRGAANISMLISVTGVSYIIQNALMLIFGSQKISFPKVFDFSSFAVGNILITSTQLMVVIITTALLAGLGVVTRCTKIGLAMRCIAQNFKAANMVGIDVRQVISVTFIISGMCAAIAGYMISGYYQMVYFTMGTAAGLKAFAAAVLGGIGVLSGSVVGGLLVGLCEALATVFLGGQYAEAAAYVILFLVLLFKPAGLFGKESSIEKV